MNFTKIAYFNLKKLRDTDLVSMTILRVSEALLSK